MISCGSTNAAQHSECLSISTSILLETCIDGYYCAITDLDGYIQGTNTTTVSCEANRIDNVCNHTSVTTGHTCCDNSNCVTGFCYSGMCVGYDESHQCYTDSDCSANMYCNPNPNNNWGQCEAAFTLGQNCDFDNECASGLGCSRGSCVGLGSLDIGVKTDEAVFCKTLFASSKYYCDSIDVYVNGKKILSPFACNSGDTCIYKLSYDGSIYANSTCHCDGSQDGVGFCDEYAQYDKNVAEYATSQIVYTVSNCSGDNASTLDPLILYECGSIDITQYYYYANFTQVVKNWALYNSHVIDSCALSLGVFDPNFQISKGLRFIFTGILTAIYSI